ncbi:MAG: peptide chain release factor N(5)-glutamine methyltransferase [Deltaproteobacteria bacterium]|jgi:release factor glutamine methyltransferase|nr:peptide chain release factor N(5)-glutamine methyltransferase [Deltaproteobacteria bacterium]
MNTAPKTWTIGDILNTTAKFLTKYDISTPRLDAELLLAKVLNLSRVKLYINFERVLSTHELDEYREFVRRRSKYEPVAYILGEKEFYGLKLKVNSHTLIPRPDTECMVDEALRLAQEFTHDSITIADIGCGSGAIALALKSNLPKSRVIASDISLESLEVAKENAKNLNLDIEFFQDDLMLPPFPDLKFEIICANLPYISTAAMPHLDKPILCFEPQSALCGGKDGLEFYSRLIPEAAEKLVTGGALLIELDPHQFPPMVALAEKLKLKPQDPIKDLAGLDRIFVSRKPS